METTTKVLGMNLAELSLRDISEEITDLKRDLSAIEDFEKGYLTYGELTRETMFQPSQKQSIIDGIAALKREKQNRNTDNYFENEDVKVIEMKDGKVTSVLRKRDGSIFWVGGEMHKFIPIEWTIWNIEIVDGKAIIQCNNYAKDDICVEKHLYSGGHKQHFDNYNTDSSKYIGNGK